jgi:hypothetical protein
MRLRIVLLVALVLLVAGAQPALAWRHGVFVGVGPLWYPWHPWYGYPYPYPYPYAYPAPPVVIERPEPQVYVQSQPAQPPAQNYWYYCEDPKGYYPYVSQCPRGWMQVVPQAPSR